VLTVALFGVVLVVLTTVIHYEVLRGLSMALPRLAVPARSRLMVVIIATFVAHTSEIILYGLAYLVLEHWAGLGGLGQAGPLGFASTIYFSAETYTSLGYGDVTPSGDLRMLAGIEALNGLLLIGWSASYTYIAMERFWKEDGPADRTAKGGER